MYLRSIIFILLVSVFISCEDEGNNPDDKEEVTTINGETFTPTQVSCLNNGEGFELSFTEGSKTVEIITNDTVAGTYTITTISLKSGELQANLTYSDGTVTYTANSGTVEVSQDSDGTISGNYDATVTSAENVTLEISSGSFSGLEAEPAEEPEPEPEITESIINDTLLISYTNFNEYIELTDLFDAVYSNQASAPNAAWTAIYDHNQNTTDSKVAQLWENAWDIIFVTNFIIENAADAIIDEADRNPVVAQAKTIRAFLYFSLLSWFGDIPIELDITGGSNARSPQADVLALIREDAAMAVDHLPESWTGDETFRLPKSFAQSILIRTYLYEEDFMSASAMAEQIINGSMYALNIDPDNFTEGGGELFYGFARGDNTEFNTFFTKGTYVPVIRYTETLLAAAEASFNLGDMMKALNYINELKARRDEPESATLNNEDIFDQWLAELYFEGSIFAVYKRFEKAESGLAISTFRQLLPIPQSVIDTNPLIVQNPGY